MIDHFGFSTKIPFYINKTFLLVQNTYRKVKAEKGWSKAHKYTNDNGINIYFKYNKTNEYYAMYVYYSPHKQSNKNLHNANDFSLDNAQKTIISINKGIGIDEVDFRYFEVFSIEIGINYHAPRPPKEILNSLLNYKTYFFEVKDKVKKPFYSTAEPKTVNKYLKIKHYSKGRQKIESINKTFAELGYCEDDMMRFEVKVERAKKNKNLPINYLSDVFADQMKKALCDFILKEHQNVFYYCKKDIDTRNLNNVQRKHLHQWNVSHFWENLSARKRKKEIELYNQMPKKGNIKTEVENAIKTKMKEIKTVRFSTNDFCKNRAFFHSTFIDRYPAENTLKSPTNGVLRKLCHFCTYIDIGKTV